MEKCFGPISSVYMECSVSMKGFDIGSIRHFHAAHHHVPPPLRYVPPHNEKLLVRSMWRKTAVLMVVVIGVCVTLQPFHTTSQKNPPYVPLPPTTTPPGSPTATPVDKEFALPTVEELKAELTYPSPRSKRPAWRTLLRVHFRYGVFLGFMNQHHVHISALAIAMRLRADVLMTPCAFSKRSSKGMKDLRSCVQLEHMYDVPLLRRRLKEEHGMDVVLDQRCRQDGDENRLDFMALVFPRNTTPIPHSVANVSFPLAQNLPMEDLIRTTFNNGNKSSEVFEQLLHAMATHNVVDVLIDTEGCWGIFHRLTLTNCTHANCSNAIVLTPRQLTDDEVTLFRIAADFFLLAPPLLLFVANISIALRKWSTNFTAFHLRGEADNPWASPYEQILFFRDMKAKHGMPNSVYVATGLNTFKGRTRRTQEEESYLRYAGGSKFTNAELIYPEFKQLSFELAAAVNFFVTLESDWVVSIAGSSWGVAMAQYRLYYRNNHRTILFQVTPSTLGGIHTFLYSVYPKEFCSVNMLDAGCG